MKPKAVKKDINGWSIISKWLSARDKRQSDLASRLKITASAVSQIKSGSIMLNAEQLYTIIDFLKINKRDMLAFYTNIFNARLTNGTGKNWINSQKLVVNLADSETSASEDLDFFSSVKDHSSDYPNSVRRIPLITFEQATNYEPALEPIEVFASGNASKSILSTDTQSGSFGLVVDEQNCTNEFAQSSILLVAGKEYPVHGDMVVAKIRDGQVITRYYYRENDLIHLKSQNKNVENLIWNSQKDPGYIQWMYPVVEINLKMRAEKYNFSDQ
jgi:SOS-response transcriptional repressor LexA/DNA-binding Xre family transcriptional regulator